MVGVSPRRAVPEGARTTISAGTLRTHGSPRMRTAFTIGYVRGPTKPLLGTPTRVPHETRNPCLGGGENVLIVRKVVPGARKKKKRVAPSSPASSRGAEKAGVRRGVGSTRAVGATAENREADADAEPEERSGWSILVEGVCSEDALHRRPPEYFCAPSKAEIAPRAPFHHHIFCCLRWFDYYVPSSNRSRQVPFDCASLRGLHISGRSYTNFLFSPSFPLRFHRFCEAAVWGQSYNPYQLIVVAYLICTYAKEVKGKRKTESNVSCARRKKQNARSLQTS